MKNTKKALLTSALCLLLCCSMLIGTTFAWFTDEVKSGNNIIQAGNLDVELEYAKVVNGQITAWDTVAGKTAIFDPNALWEPGHVEVVYLKVSNLGTLELKYQLGVNIISETPSINVENEPFALSEHLVFKVVEMPDALATFDDREAAQLAAGTEKGLKDYNGETKALDPKGGENDMDYVALIVYMPETVGNEANYKKDAPIPTINLGINLFATQKDAESDSFGPDYDEDAWHPAMKVYSAQDLQAAINNGETNIVVMDDIDLTEAIVIPAPAAGGSRGGSNVPAFIVINLNGKTISATTRAFTNNGNLIITGNGTIDVSSAVSAAQVIDNYGTLIIKNGTFKGTEALYSYAIRNNGSLKIENATVIGGFGGLGLNGGSAIIENGSYTLTGNDGGHLVYLQGSAELVINNGTFTDSVNDSTIWTYSFYMNGADTKVTVNGGKIIGLNTGRGITVNGGKGTFSINGGVVEGKFFANEQGGKTIISGGTFSENPTAYVADGYNVIDGGEFVHVLPNDTNADLYIDSVADLINFAADVNAGNNYQGKTVMLLADINLDNMEWTPIGTDGGFNGTFDGNGHTISNLKITGNKSTVGLFANTYNGEIKNLTIENALVSGRLNVGVVAGNPYTSKYTNITVKGHVEVNGMAYVGGVGGKNAYADWTNITVDVDDSSYVKAISTENGMAYRTYVGGVVGFNGEGGHTFKNITTNINVIGDVCDIGGVFGIAHYGNKFENIICTGDVTNLISAENDGDDAATDVLETGLIAGVWHNENNTFVSFTNIAASGSIHTPNVAPSREFDNNGLIGKKYSASSTGILIIDGKDADGNWAVTDAASLEYALTKGGEIKLYKDVKVEETMHILANTTVEMDLNGKTVTGTMHKDNGAVLKNEGTLTIVGGTIKSTAANGGAAILNKGTLTISDATLNGAPNAGGSWPSYTVNNTGVMTANNVKITSYHGAVASYGEGAVLTLNGCEIDMAGIPGFTSHGIYTYNGGSVVVNDGVYANKATDQNASGASVINGSVTVNAGTFNGRIEAYYGTPVIKGGTFNVNPTSRVAAGYEAVDNGDGTWTVKTAN